MLLDLDLSSCTLVERPVGTWIFKLLILLSLVSPVAGTVGTTWVLWSGSSLLPLRPSPPPHTRMCAQNENPSSRKILRNGIL